jgi:hypothetical protein
MDYLNGLAAEACACPVFALPMHVLGLAVFAGWELLWRFVAMLEQLNKWSVGGGRNSSSLGKLKQSGQPFDKNWEDDTMWGRSRFQFNCFCLSTYHF